MFVHNNTVFPIDESFAMRKEKNSFSTLLYNQFQDDSTYKNEKEFTTLLTSNKSVWYTCCNQVRGDLIFQTKQKYFSEYTMCFNVFNLAADSIHFCKRFISREAKEIRKDSEREDAQGT